MKMKRILLTTIVLLTAFIVSADNYRDLESLTLEVPEMKPELTMTSATEQLQTMSTPNLFQEDESVTEQKKWKPDFDFFKSKTNPGTRPYTFMEDMTWVGIPFFIAGWAVKGEKAMFRVNNKEGKKNTQLLTDFKTGIDDYTQFFGPAMVVGLKLGGVEGRSDWPRLMASSLMGYAIMAGMVNGIKYTAKEMRPDGSTANSWPSGHTATSFVGATILHKEYGLTRSPWYSVAGYGVATATGVMRVLNNRHWISDVMSGAGIGILSGELGYALCDLLFKGKGLLRNDLVTTPENPTFFAVSMGLGLGSKSLDISASDLVDAPKYAAAGMELEADASEKIEFRAATVVDAEGAYFFNKYIGVGGRFRIRAMSAKTFGQYADISSEISNLEWLGVVGSIYDQFNQTAAIMNMTDVPVTKLEGRVKSDHIAEFTGSVGVYLNLPLTKNLSVGTKFLIGRSITQDMEIDGYAEGNMMNINYDMKITNGAIANPATDVTLYTPTKAGTFTDEWDYITLSAKNSTSYGTGISLNYRYKSNFSWRLFCDYDYTKKDYTLNVDTYHYITESLTPQARSLVSNPLVSPYAVLLDPVVFKKTKKMNYWTIGLSFLVDL